MGGPVFAMEREYMRVIERFRKTGERYVPHRFPDGCFRVADPALGEAKKLAQNQIAVRTEDELLTLIRRRFHVRMRGEKTRQVNLIRPEEIVIR